MFSLKKICSHVYALEFEDPFELAMAFLRYQEFYESSNSDFLEQPFTLAEYMSWYAKEFGDGAFTYPQDWGGFNMPVQNIMNVHEKGITDPNHYDSLMLGIAKMIEVQDPGSYLIGINSSDTVDKHELTHAMFYVDESYHDAVTQAMSSFKKESFETYADLIGCLLADGYCAKTSEDEIQAYITTGEMNYFDSVENQVALNVFRQTLKQIHDTHFEKFLSS